MAFANLKPVGFTNVDIRDGFWKKRIYAVNTVTSWSCIDQCEKTVEFQSKCNLFKVNADKIVLFLKKYKMRLFFLAN